MSRHLFLYIALIMISSVYAGEASKAVNQIKDTAVNQAFSYGDSAVE